MACIYIVEDDTDIREIETIALRNSGHTVADFDSGRAFFHKVEEKVPDLALLDIMLPDMDGYEIVKKLRSNPGTKRLPVIMVTAKTTEIDMIKGLDIGADDYIKKPFSVMELITRVKAVLRRTMEQDDSKFLSLGEVFLDNERHMVYVNDQAVELTFKAIRTAEASYGKQRHCDDPGDDYAPGMGDRIRRRIPDCRYAH